MKSKSNGKATWHPGARLLSDASLSFFVEGRILESPRRSRDLNVHGRQSKPGFHFNANMAIMRLWQSISASQKNLNEAQNVAYLCSLRKQTFQMHGSFRCPLLAHKQTCSDADECPLLGAKRTSLIRSLMSANNPERTSQPIDLHQSALRP